MPAFLCSEVFMKNEHDVDPKKDWVFKLMFTHGEMGNTALMEALINSIEN